MTRQMDRPKYSEWQQRLHRFTKSGLTVARFCERVAVGTFWYRRRKRSGQAPDSKALASTFAPVEVIGGRMATLRFPAGAVLVACFGNSDPVGMKVYSPEGKAIFNDDATTEEAPS